MDQVIQLVGAAFVLAAFVVAQTRRLSPSSPVYLVLNFVGGLVLAVVAALAVDLGFFVLEAVWAGVSAAGLVRYVATRRARGAADRGAVVD